MNRCLHSHCSLLVMILHQCCIPSCVENCITSKSEIVRSEVIANGSSKMCYRILPYYAPMFRPRSSYMTCLVHSRTPRSLCCVDETTHVTTIAGKLCTAACPATDGDEVAL